MDDTSIQGQLTELKRLSLETNRILKDMRRDALIAGIIRMLVWAAVLVGSYYFTMQFLAPYLSILETMPKGEEGQDFGALLQQAQQLMGQ